MANNNKSRHRRFAPQVEVKGDKEVLSAPIESLGLPEETLVLLKNNRFNTVFDIARRTERDMFRVQTFNKKHLIAVKKAINAKGIDFLPFVKEEKPDEQKKQDNLQEKSAGRSPDVKPQDVIRHGEKPQNRDNRQQKNRDRGKCAQQDNRLSKPQNQNSKQNQKNGQKQKPQQERRPKVELPVEEWLKISKNGKWGFSNGLTTVIEPRFDEVFCFKDGVACVDDNGKFGYIDTKGDYVIEPKFECAMSCSEGLAVFFEGEKCGYINKEGNVVLPAKYDAATAFENGRAKVKEFGKWSTIDTEGNTLWSK